MEIQARLRWFVLALLLSGAGAAGAATTSALDADLIFHLTDFGINQWDKNLRTGQDFGVVKSAGGVVNTVYPDLCSGRPGCAAQILVVMPDVARPGSALLTDLRPQFKQAILDKVAAARRQGIREFEIQLIQNIDTKTYASRERA